MTVHIWQHGALRSLPPGRGRPSAPVHDMIRLAECQCLVHQTARLRQTWRPSPWGWISPQCCPLLLPKEGGALLYSGGAYNLGLHAWLQTALGELTFESEAAERLRGELRAAERQQGALQQQVAAAQAAAEAAQQAERAARAEAEEARRTVQLQSDSDRQLQVRPPVFGAASSFAEPLLVTPEQPSSCSGPQTSCRRGRQCCTLPLLSPRPAPTGFFQLPMLRLHAGHRGWQVCRRMQPPVVQLLVHERSEQHPRLPCDRLLLSGCRLGGCGHAAGAPS